MIVGSTQPITEMISRYVSWGIKTAGARVYNLTTFMCRVREIWEPQQPGTLRTSPGLYRDCFSFYFGMNQHNNIKAILLK